jgi:hypothetical protein
MDPLFSTRDLRSVHMYLPPSDLSVVTRSDPLNSPPFFFFWSDKVYIKAPYCFEVCFQILLAKGQGGLFLQLGLNGRWVD